jgi:hypothetical protein
MISLRISQVQYLLLLQTRLQNLDLAIIWKKKNLARRGKVKWQTQIKRDMMICNQNSVFKNLHLHLGVLQGPGLSQSFPQLNLSPFSLFAMGSRLSTQLETLDHFIISMGA